MVAMPKAQARREFAQLKVISQNLVASAVRRLPSRRRAEAMAKTGVAVDDTIFLAEDDEGAKSPDLNTARRPARSRRLPRAFDA